MPRRKTSVLDGVEIPGNRGEVHSAAIEALDNLPPGLYAMMTTTPHQRLVWNQNRQFFKQVGAVIDSYFSGDAPPDYGAMPKYRQEEIWNEAWVYLSFYSMAWSSWTAIKGALSVGLAPRIPVSNRSFLPVAQFSDLSTPLDLSLEVMRYRAIHRMSVAFSLEPISVTPYQVRKRLSRVNSARKANAPKSLVATVEIEESEIYKTMPWIDLQLLCYKAVEDSSPTGIQRDHMQSYLKATRAEEQHLAKRMHKRAKPKAIVCRNGVYEICD